MRKPGPQARQQKPGWWKRQERVTKLLIWGLSAVVVLLIVAVVLVATLANRNGSPATAASTTTLSTVAQSETTTTTSAAGAGTTTTAAGTAGTTTTVTAAESTTTVTATSDTADHAPDYRAQHPSTELFTNANWATLDVAPGSYLGAAVDVVGQPANVAIDPGTGYLTWHLSIPSATGSQMQALCRTNVNVNRNLLSGGGWVEVRGVAVGPAPAGSIGAVIYVETISPATAPVTTTTTAGTAGPTTTT
jgi:uncharacterized protein (DUF736 family)